MVGAASEIRPPLGLTFTPFAACAEATDEEYLMLREDKKLELIRLSVTLPRMFTGRWALRAGQKLGVERWKDDVIAQWRVDQTEHPVPLRAEARRTLWWFRDRFYSDDDGHSAEEVKALALQGLRRAERRLKTAQALMESEADASSGRAPIPPAVAQRVFARDGRRCVACGASEDLQFDHIIPVVLGGATSVENLQILCGDCNREKGVAL